MLSKIRSAVFAVLSATFLVFATAPAEAQTQPVSVGHGSFLAANQQDVLQFTYVVVEHGAGLVAGYALFRGSDGIVVFQVDSFMFLDEQTLAFAGPIVLVIGNPEPGFVVGATAFTGFKDNGFGSTDETVSIAQVPPEFGNLTIQEIIAFAGPPPPSAFRPLLSGDVLIF